jgi:hypothetical protein
VKSIIVLDAISHHFDAKMLFTSRKHFGTYSQIQFRVEDVVGDCIHVVFESSRDDLDTENISRNVALACQQALKSPEQFTTIRMRPSVGGLSTTHDFSMSLVKIPIDTPEHEAPVAHDFIYGYSEAGDGLLFCPKIGQENSLRVELHRN